MAAAAKEEEEEEHMPQKHNLKATVLDSNATYTGSLSHGSGPSGPRPQMMLGTSRCAERRHREASTSQRLEVGGNEDMYLHALPKLTWSAGCIKILSSTTRKQIRK